MAAPHRRITDLAPFVIAGLVIMVVCVAGGAAAVAYVRHVNRPDPPPSRQYAGGLAPVEAFDALHIDVVGHLELRLELSADRAARVSWDLGSRHDGPRVDQTVVDRTLRVTGGCTPPLSGCAGVVDVAVPAGVPVTAQAKRIIATGLAGDARLKAEWISGTCLSTPTFEAVAGGHSFRTAYVGASFLSVTHLHASAGKVSVRVPPGDYAIRARAGGDTGRGVHIDGGVRADASAPRTIDISAASPKPPGRSGSVESTVTVYALVERPRGCEA